MGISAATAAIVAAVAGVAGAGVATYGAMESANAQSQAARYNAEVAQQNAKIATQNATMTAQAGEQQAAQQQQKTRAEVGAIKASQAASGIDVNSGSAVDVQSSAASLGELNAITLRSNAAKEAYGYETQSTSFVNQSQLDSLQAQNAMQAGAISAGATFLGGVGSASSNYSRYLSQTNPITP